MGQSILYICTMMQTTIEQAWENREMLKDNSVQKTIRDVIEEIDKGRIRIAEPSLDGWKVNDWVKKAVIMYFPSGPQLLLTATMQTMLW